MPSPIVGIERYEAFGSGSYRVATRHPELDGR